MITLITFGLRPARRVPPRLRMIKIVKTMELDCDIREPCASDFLRTCPLPARRNQTAREWPAAPQHILHQSELETHGMRVHEIESTRATLPGKMACAAPAVPPGGRSRPECAFC